jgi:DNA adenine methylase
MLKLNNISPLRYPGGKTKARKIIEKILLEHFNINDFDTLISPFFGGGSFEFYMQNKYELMIIANDKFIPLYNFWKQVKINNKILCDELKKIINVKKEDFITFRKEIINNNNNSVLQQAIYYFIINRCSFSGATLSGGFSEQASKKRYTTSSINKIEKLDFTKIEIYNYDFIEFINIYANNNIKYIMFLDPPYYLNKKSKLYGNNGDMHENFNHEQLYNILKYKKNWIITYNDSDYIRNMYKDFIILDVVWKYGMNKTKESCEIVIISK